MADPVKAGFDVRFEDPLRAGCDCAECVEALRDRIRCRSLLAESVGVRVAVGFRDGVERQQVECLHRSVLHRGDPEGTYLPVALRDVDAPQRVGLIATLLQRHDCLLLSSPACSR